MEYNQDLPKGLGREPVYCWGHKNVPKQVGVVTYTLSPNRQRPMAQAFHRAIFNTFRRSKAQFLYVAPPFIVAYLLMSWANRRYEYLQSKAGRWSSKAAGAQKTTSKDDLKNGQIASPVVGEGDRRAEKS